MNDSAKLIGFSKKDLDTRWSQLVAKIKNLKKDRDTINVSFPESKIDHLVIHLNDTVLYDRPLPGPILRRDCKSTVSYGSKGKLKIKLKKAEPGEWVNKWSPSRDNTSSLFGSSAGTDSLSSNSQLSISEKS